ncbi:MAG TPA: Gfo/Idh/MocA family oxidoreductase [Trueperaceae bacterium]|nr:Gfo/Idh/MocA family oxidoreductase [Trueperaceae bacterium]
MAALPTSSPSASAAAPLDPVRVAVIGTGSISRRHVAGYRDAGAEVVAICDSHEAALERRGREWDVPRRYLDYHAMFQDGGFDAVSIAAPTAVHHPATLAAAAAGVHVLVEKPIALSLALADEMIAACREAGVVLQVNHQLRSGGPARKAKELLDAGAIGRVTYVRLRQAHDWAGLGVRPSFRTRASAGGGTLLDNGCHLMDLARFFGGRVEDVYARTATLQYDVELEDTAVVSLRFEDGALGTVETAWTATGWEQGFWVYGTEGALECTNRFGPEVLRHSYRASPGTTWGETDVATYDFAGPGPHSRHVTAFLAAVRGEGPVACSGEDGREAVRLVLAAYESAAQARALSLRDGYAAGTS